MPTATRLIAVAIDSRPGRIFPTMPTVLRIKEWIMIFVLGETVNQQRTQ
jgi:hypothetical protein